MILKEHEIPELILKLEALLLRIPIKHPKKAAITDELKMRMAGFQGEKSIDYPLSFLPEKDYYIFHDLRLKTKKHFFQIDTLIIAKKLAMIIEVKNLTGTIYFDTAFKQLIQTKGDGNEKGYSYPLTQLERQKSQFKEWLTLNRFRDINIVTLVVISSPQTIIRTSSNSNSIQQKVIHKEELPAKFKQVENSLENITDYLEEKELKKISKSLLKQHIPLKTNILNRYQIDEQEIVRGVICHNCKFLPLARVKGNWYCQRCKNKDKQAHIQTLYEYSLLIKPSITNSEAREFLLIDSVFTSNRLLKSLDLSFQGSNKNRVYDLSTLKQKRFK